MKLNHFTKTIVGLAGMLSLVTGEENSAPKADDSAWQSAKLYGHAFSNKDFTEEEYDFISEKFSMFAIEKRHANKVYGPASSERATIETARKLHKKQPNLTTLFYWNCDLIYAPLYESLVNLAEEQPTWVRESRFKKVTAAKNGYNFGEKAAQEFWVNKATEMVADPAIGGVFVDASSKAALNGQLEIVHELMDRLPGIVLYNGYRYHPSTKGFFGGPETLKHADGVFVEAFLSGPVNSAERASAVLDGLIAIPEEKYIICNGLIDGFGANGSHKFSFAAYLIVANENTYYRYGKGHHFDNKHMTFWHEDFGKKIGHPKGKATKDGMIYRRSFENVEVELNLEAQTCEINWKS